MGNKTKRIFKFSIFFFLLSVLLFSGVVFGTVWFDKKLDDSSLALKAEIGKITNLKDVSLMLNETKDKRDYVSSLFVDKDSIIDFLDLLESIGKQTGATVSVISVADEEKVGFVGGNRIRLEVKGSWGQVFKSLYALDHMPATFFLRNVSLTEEESDEKFKKGFWQADVDAVILKSNKNK